MKVKTIIGMIISVLIITYIITVTIKTNIAVEEYPSCLIEDQLEELTRNNSDSELGSCPKGNHIKQTGQLFSK